MKICAMHHSVLADGIISDVENESTNFGGPSPRSQEQGGITFQVGDTKVVLHDGDFY